MKISKSLLQAIVVGVTLGTATSSCDLIETISKDEIKQEQPQEEGNQVTPSRENENEGGNTCYDCPGCGMG
jgi:hypothetical protein